MSRDELRVTAAHLGDLAARQGRAAAEIRSATASVDGVDAALRTTHGPIASATTTALDRVLSARRTAGTKMADVSDGLSDKLAQAGQHYGRVDDSFGGTFDAQIPQG